MRSQSPAFSARSKVVMRDRAFALITSAVVLACGRSALSAGIG